ncbi:MAG: zinc carboxypeptidase [Bdellovibrio sp.]|nr:MAG: zinc carboxypeptidase [Bdellovibrio sp.]
MKYLLIAFIYLFSLHSGANEKSKDTLYYMKIKAKNKFERTDVANTGVAIEKVEDNFVYAIGLKKEAQKLKKMGRLVSISPLSKSTHLLDFPPQDSQFHNYAELLEALNDIQKMAPQIVSLGELGKSLEGRSIPLVTLSEGSAEGKAGIFFMGAHHAREHLSVETPLLILKELVQRYLNGDQHIKKLIQNRVIYIAPMVNPDGAEYDIASGSYRMWRKNRRPNDDGSYGVDLNRNYDHMWGGVGSSDDPRSQVYHGKAPFSEPETQAIRDFVTSHDNITTILTYHSFSELILYPWGYTYDPISNQKDRQVFETMAQTMSQWNHYKPQKSSDLYRTTGETCDWAYAKFGIFCFTFELDPDSIWKGGFYPGQKFIDIVFKKNFQPALYLIEYANNPYRVLEPSHLKYGLSTPLIQ